jgi:hypothetical protein
MIVAYNMVEALVHTQVEVEVVGVIRPDNNNAVKFNTPVLSGELFVLSLILEI